MTTNEKVYIGILEKKTVAKTSKSERRALLLRVSFPDDKKVLIIRRRGLGAFQTDYELETLIGKRVAFCGIEHGNTLIVGTWRLLE